MPLCFYPSHCGSVWLHCNRFTASAHKFPDWKALTKARKQNIVRACNIKPAFVSLHFNANPCSCYRWLRVWGEGGWGWGRGRGEERERHLSHSHVKLSDNFITILLLSPQEKKRRRKRKGGGGKKKKKKKMREIKTHKRFYNWTPTINWSLDFNAQSKVQVTSGRSFYFFYFFINRLNTRIKQCELTIKQPVHVEHKRWLRRNPLCVF